MANNASLDGRVTQSTPLLEVGDGGGEEREDRRGRNQVSGWWNRVLDFEEAKIQLRFSLPMILTNTFYYMITLVSVMFAGHLGELQLAGSSLANSWNSVTGVAVMVSLFSLLLSVFLSFGCRNFQQTTQIHGD